MSDHDAPAVFLDRDGVIIAEKHYISDPDQVAVLPGVSEKLAEIRDLNIPIIVLTNQSAIGQGLFGWDSYDRVNSRILEILGIEAPFTAVYANSYPPSAGTEQWRKPNPGMFIQAALDLNLDLSSSLMVGDKWVDLEAASRAGVGRLVHVLTGHGIRERAKVLESFPQASIIDSLAQLDIETMLRARDRDATSDQ